MLIRMVVKQMINAEFGSKFLNFIQLTKDY